MFACTVCKCTLISFLHFTEELDCSLKIKSYKRSIHFASCKIHLLNLLTPGRWTFVICEEEKTDFLVAVLTTCLLISPQSFDFQFNFWFAGISNLANTNSFYQLGGPFASGHCTSVLLICTSPDYRPLLVNMTSLVPPPTHLWELNRFRTRVIRWVNTFLGIPLPPPFPRGLTLVGAQEATFNLYSLGLSLMHQSM